MRRAAVWATSLGLLLVGCESGQIEAPVPTGVQWTRITSPQATFFPLYPDWRGDSIVFEYFVANSAGARSRLATIRPDGSFLQLIPGGVANSNDFYPRWQNDSVLVFASNRAGPNAYDVWFYTTTTGEIRNLIGSSENERYPVPQPGGAGLAFTTGTEDSGRVALMPDMGTPTNFVYLTPATLVASEPDWDPSGQRLCFTADSADGSHHIWIVSLADTLPKQLTTGPFRDHHPRFSPDGTRILFTSNRTGRSGLWTVSPQGEGVSLNVVAFEDAGRTLFTPCWSPDGTRIVVSSDGRGYGRSLWVLSNLP